MTEKKITRKVIKKVSTENSEPAVVQEVKQADEEQKVSRPKKACMFCQGKISPSYTDMVSLRRFVTDRGKIMPKLKTSLCSKHQRAVTKQIKYARHLALLPFIPKV